MEELRETTNIDVLEVVEETTTNKPYEFRKFTSQDIFTMVSILSKIGVNRIKDCFQNKEVQEMIKDLKDKEEMSTEDLNILGGGAFFLEVVQILLEGMPRCEEDMYKLLSNTSNLTIQQLKDMEGARFVEMIYDFVKKDDFVDFIKVVSKFFNMAN